jgi:hypothetical protein
MGRDREGVENKTQVLYIYLHVYIYFSFHLEESFKVSSDMYGIHYI